MENHFSNLNEKDNQIIKNILYIKQCILQGNSEQDIYNKLHNLLDNNFMMIYNKLDKNKYLTLNIVAISTSLIDTFDNFYYSPKYLGSLEAMIYKLFKLSSFKEESSTILSHFFTFLTKPKNKQNKYKKFLSKITAEKLKNRFPDSYYQEIISFMNNDLKHKILFHIVTRTLNCDFAKKLLLKSYDLIQMLILGIGKNSFDNLLLEYSINMLLLHLSANILQNEETSFQIVTKLLPNIKQIFQIFIKPFTNYTFHSKLLYIIQYLYNKKRNNKENINTNNDIVVSVDVIFDDFNLDYNLLLSMLEIKSYYEDLCGFLINKRLCNNKRLLYFYNKFGIIENNTSIVFEINIDLTQLINKDIFKLDNELITEKIHFTFEDCLFSEVLNSITSLICSNIMFNNNNISNTIVDKCNREGYFIKTLTKFTNLINDLSICKQIYILTFLQKVIEECGNNLWIEWELIMNLLKSFLINKDYLEVLYKNMLKYIMHYVTYKGNLYVFSDILSEFYCPEDLKFSLLQMNLLFGDLKRFQKYFKKQIFFFHDVILNNTQNIPKEMFSYKFEEFSLFFDKITRYFGQMQKDKNISELEAIILQTYPEFLLESNNLDIVYISSATLISKSERKEFIQQFIQKIITRFYNSSICERFLHETINNLYSISSLNNLQIVLDSLTDIIDIYKANNNFSLINTIFNFISNYSVSNDFYLVSTKQSYKYPITVEYNPFIKEIPVLLELNALFKVNKITDYFAKGLKDTNAEDNIINLLTKFNSLLKHNLGFLKGIDLSILLNNLKSLLKIYTASQPYNTNEQIYKLLIECINKLVYHLDLEGTDKKYGLCLCKDISLIKEIEKTDLIELLLKEFNTIIGKIIGVSVRETANRTKLMSKANSNIKTSSLNEQQNNLSPFSELPEMIILLKSIILLFSLINFYFYSLYDYSKPSNEAHTISKDIEEKLCSFLKSLSQIANDVIPVFPEQIHIFRFLLLQFIIYNHKLISCYSSVVIKLAHFLLNITWPGQQEQLIDAFGKEIHSIVLNLLTYKVPESNNMIFEITCDYYLSKLVIGHKMMINLYQAIIEGLNFKNSVRSYESVEENKKEKFRLLRKEVFINLLKWGMMSGEDCDNTIYKKGQKTDWKKTRTYLQVNNKYMLLNCEGNNIDKEKIHVLMRSELSNREFTLLKMKEESKEKQILNDNDNEEEKEQQQLIEAIQAFNIENYDINSLKQKENKKAQIQKSSNQIQQKETTLSDLDYVINTLQRFNYTSNFKEITNLNVITKFNSIALARHYISQVYYYDVNNKRVHNYHKKPDKSFYKVFSLLGHPNNNFTYVYMGVNLSITFTYSENNCTVPVQEGFSCVSLLYTTSSSLSKIDEEEIKRITRKRNGIFIRISPVNESYYNVEIYEKNIHPSKNIMYFDLLFTDNIIHIDHVADFVRKNIIIMNLATILFKDEELNDEQTFSGIYMRYKSLLQIEKTLH